MAVAAEKLKSIHACENGTDKEKTRRPQGIATFFEEAQFARLREMMNPRHVQAGSCLFWEGDTADNLYYIESGRVKLRRTTEDGKEFILTIAQAGDLICEPDDGSRMMQHSYNAEVIEDAKVGVIQWKDLEVALYQHSDFAVRFMNWMALSRRISESKFRDLMLFGKPGALASTLIRLANTYGIMTADGIKIDIKLTNSELAAFIGSTRESVNRMLAGFADEGTIAINKGYIFIMQLSALQEICQCPDCPACPVDVCRI